jgi:hypothetical protein
LEPTSQAAGQKKNPGSRAQSGHSFMLSFVKRTMKHLYHAKWGKALLVLFLVGIVASAGATVSVFYYAGGTASVQTPDVQLAAGPDLHGSCTAYPCASGTVAATHDSAVISMSFYPSTATTNPTIYPATYYSNLLQINNVAGSGSHSIESVQIIDVSQSASALGSITIYYCTTQTEFTAAGALVTPGNCVGSFTITTTSGGSVSGISSGSPVTLTHGGTNYIEVVAYASSSGTGTVNFQIAVQWV